MKQIAYSAIGLALSLSLLGLPASAQNHAANSQSSASGTPSGSSLGDYARQVRKDPGTPQKKKVFDNDNLPVDDKLSIVGPTAASTPSSDSSAEAKPADSTAAASSDVKSAANSQTQLKEEAASKDSDKQAAVKQWADKLASQKDQIDLMARELDVLQREYQ